MAALRQREQRDSPSYDRVGYVHVVRRYVLHRQISTYVSMASEEAQTGRLRHFRAATPDCQVSPDGNGHDTGSNGISSTGVALSKTTGWLCQISEWRLT